MPAAVAARHQTLRLRATTAGAHLGVVEGGGRRRPSQSIASGRRKRGPNTLSPCRHILIIICIIIFTRKYNRCTRGTPMPRMAISRAGPTGLSRPSGAARRAPGGRGARGRPPPTPHTCGAPRAAPPKTPNGGCCRPRVLCVYVPLPESPPPLLLPSSSPRPPAAPNRRTRTESARARTRAQPAPDSQTRGARSHTLRTLIQGHRPVGNAPRLRARPRHTNAPQTRSLGNAQPCCRAPRHIEPLITYTRTHAHTHTWRPGAASGRPIAPVSVINTHPP